MRRKSIALKNGLSAELVAITTPPPEVLSACRRVCVYFPGQEKKTKTLKVKIRGETLYLLYLDGDVPVEVSVRWPAIRSLLKTNLSAAVQRSHCIIYQGQACHTADRSAEPLKYAILNAVKPSIAMLLAKTDAETIIPEEKT